jgi:uncharacterized protein (TIGR02646 family)
MVPLVRGAAPEILQKKAIEWTAQYEAKWAAAPVGDKPRPDSSKYGHRAVRVELRRMSFGKCFYCERKLGDGEDEVDHFIEVAERTDLAFDWRNLCLACSSCNQHKAPNKKIAVLECVDPCAPGVTPPEHLTFRDELIVARDEKGRKTIAKFLLERDDLDNARMRHLKEFLKRLTTICLQRAEESRKQFSPDELRILRTYRDASSPFAMMMDIYLTHLGI